ncbi:flagellar basal body P-ring formation protein FlgA [Buttiauxella warmboldiae]|uniref:Flagella basal body P-ring formation protein FlgA n=1 Tax=Buttiauxella warmboldiae TaxID=82993 RepID=A0A3N5E2P6_9ENTR|nr:flagellar basal body P-ring formation chaperone FlgA [Buttiauxella warmboldiae]RPH29239.1 flagellar basal body P-ring formation protein FlgA [Buttiauxella warmboldiae]
MSSLLWLWSKISLYLLLCLAAFHCAAAQSVNERLTTQIAALVDTYNDEAREAKVTHSVKILTPDRQISETCADPELFLPGNNSRLTGNKSVLVQCGSLRKFIQISIHASGSWWVALHPIQSGQVILSDDIQRRSGPLDHLPGELLFNASNIIGQTATRYINKGQPLTKNLLRKGWAIVAGHNAEIFAAGTGFQIRTKGKALNSAAAGQLVRISLRGGQIITGMTTVDGKVKINLKE